MGCGKWELEVGRGGGIEGGRGRLDTDGVGGRWDLKGWRGKCKSISILE